nr:unnamed protein product [Digitaria exilis]
MQAASGSWPSPATNLNTRVVPAGLRSFRFSRLHASIRLSFPMERCLIGQGHAMPIPFLSFSSSSRPSPLLTCRTTRIHGPRPPSSSSSSALLAVVGHLRRLSWMAPSLHAAAAVVVA